MTEVNKLDKSMVMAALFLIMLGSMVLITIALYPLPPVKEDIKVLKLRINDHDSSSVSNGSH